MIENFTPSPDLEAMIKEESISDKDLIRAERFANNYLAYNNIIEHSYDERGDFKAKSGNAEIIFSYSSPSLEEIKKFLPSSSSEDLRKYIRKVDKFSIKTDTTLNLTDSDLKIFFLTTSREKESALVDDDDQETKAIFLNEDPLTQKGLLIMLYELGYYKNSVDTIPNSENLVLRKDDEAAWQFAIEKLKPLADDLKIEMSVILEAVYHYYMKDKLKSESEPV
ncbi:hypothetical protein IPN41_03580 [Candidatus Falkowbacteria bacterium]|nr:MAG: hypothetical protein IPN41_03580 [Candidatus Falkowbacteria bacterium]